MADAYDVAEQIADDINAAITPLVGTTYPITNATEQLNQGATRTYPNTTVGVGEILLQEIMTRLEQNEASIGVTFDDTFNGAEQYAWAPDEEPQNIPTPQLVATYNGTTGVLTLTGSVQNGDVIGCQAGVLGTSVKVQTGDTLNAVASRLQVAMAADGIACSVNGAQITMTSLQPAPTFSVGTSWTRTKEIWRRRQFFYATVWAPNPFDRSALGKLVEVVYAPGARLTMPDGTLATVLGSDGLNYTANRKGQPLDTSERDMQQRDMTYVRKLRWYIDFVATQNVAVTQVVATQETTSVLQAGAAFSLTAPTASQL